MIYSGNVIYSRYVTIDAADRARPGPALALSARTHDSPMARAAPVTLDDVDAARRALTDAGVTASVRLVRQRLGRGSLTTISAHLRTLAAARAEPGLGAAPDPILATLGEAADRIWNELAEAADARVAEIAGAADARVEAAQAEAGIARSEAADAADRAGALVAAVAERDAALGDARAALDALGSDHAALGTRLGACEHERAALDARLGDRDAELERVRKDLDAHRAELATERAALATERTEHARAAAHRDGLAERLDRAETDHAEAAERHRAELRSEAARRTELDRAVAGLEARAASTAARADESATRAARLETDRDTARERSDRLSSALEAARDAALEAERVLEAWQRNALELHAHAGRLHARLVGAGVDPRRIEPVPALRAVERQPGLGLDGGAER